MSKLDTLTASELQFKRYQLARRAPRTEEERKLKAELSARGQNWKLSGSLEK